MHGNLINRIMEASAGPVPAVGMGATICSRSDRHAATIVKVTPKTVTVRRDRATRADRNGMSDAQSYTYEPDPDGYAEVFRLTKRGWKNRSGNGLAIGRRDEQHYDFSF